MRTFALAPLTVLPCSPLEQIDAALDAGFGAISFRLLPGMATDVDVMANPQLRQEMEDRVRSAGLGVVDIEVARLGPALDVAAIAPALEFGGQLGARWFTVTAATTAENHRAEDERAMIDRLAGLADEAAGHGMGIMLEFMAYRGIGTIEDAERIVRAADRPNVAICLDTLHFFRSGATISRLRTIDPQLLACVQLSDALTEPDTDLATEARYGRLYPGEGVLPLSELLAAVPAGLPLTVEAPSRTRSHLTPVQRAREAARWTRRLLADLDQHSLA
ncbi:Inosose isomerase [Amycolatopsis sp. M39]|nr:Inosose isomerase [Amycolatopsis sp. M39]